jgi:hypothetical protein
MTVTGDVEGFKDPPAEVLVEAADVFGLLASSDVTEPYTHNLAQNKTKGCKAALA